MFDFGTRIKIFFDDGEAVRFRIGTLTSYDHDFIELDKIDLIAIRRIIRMEVYSGEKTY